ncbi:type IV pilus modification PilV family protein [Pseudomonas sp.]|uniref:type IV pilus modification PilV family protein n=1 Tax=Pseudomonas sp. TaxID=306 RepID=UPI002729F11E|nr:prepilin-type N-terminal cleavage/methylation domain-containing protein [Pseudomonas sp.]
MASRKYQRGLTLIELMVTVVILLVGLLGLAGMQSRLQQSEVESYQRAQALLLLNDMSNRIMANRANAVDYVTTSATGAGNTCPAAGNTRRSQDMAEWCAALQGAAEVIDGNRVGALIGGRGCIEQLQGDTYMVTVAWQGLLPLTPPPASVSCGANAFNDTGACSDDRCRRAVTTIVRIASLGGQPPP